MEMKEATQLGHELYVYEDSEMSDQESHNFDDLWQSIYDIVQISLFGIVEQEQVDLDEAITWLENTQSLTKSYKETDLTFGKE